MNMDSDEFFRPKGVWQPSGQHVTASVSDALHCTNCHTLLTRDDVGLYRKLVNRGAETYLCKACLAEKLGMTIEDCDMLIVRFREDGCLMFR